MWRARSLELLRSRKKNFRETNALEIEISSVTNVEIIKSYARGAEWDMDQGIKFSRIEGG